MSGYRPANRGNKSTNRVGSMVSRKLRAAGWNIAPAAMRHKRDVTTVSAQGDRVSVLADTGLAGRNGRIAEGIRAELATWTQAEGIEIRPSETGAVFVSFTYRPTGS